MHAEMGPGKYDAAAQRVRDEHDADVAVVIVRGGDRGNGVACKMRAGVLPEGLMQSAVVLRAVADEMERDAMRLAGTGARARARLLLAAVRTACSTMAYGLGLVTMPIAKEGGSAFEAVAAGVGALTQAQAAFDRALAELARARGSA